MSLGRPATQAVAWTQRCSPPVRLSSCMRSERSATGLLMPNNWHRFPDFPRLGGLTTSENRDLIMFVTREDGKIVGAFASEQEFATEELPETALSWSHLSIRRRRRSISSASWSCGRVFLMQGRTRLMSPWRPNRQNCGVSGIPRVKSVPRVSSSAGSKRS